MNDPTVEPEAPWSWAKMATMILIVAMIALPAVYFLNYFAEKYHWSFNPDPETGSVEACYLSHGRQVPALIENVKSGLKQPDSFAHVETFFTPSNIVGRHSVLMRYRAKVDGIERHEKAVAEIRDGDCRILEWFVMENG